MHIPTISAVSNIYSNTSRQKINFYVYYEIDNDDVKTLLLADWYNGDDEGSWVLLEAEPADAREFV